MKHEKDKFTIELPMPGAKGKPGRPPKPDALSNAERQKAFRLRQREARAKSPEVGALSAQLAEAQRAMLFYRNSMWKMEQTINGMEKEQALLIEERGRLFAEVARLQALLSEGQPNRPK